MPLINIQPIEKRDHHQDGRLDVHSVFRTIQGEGPFTGHASVFVRLAGCNLQCPSCDTEYTSKRTLYTVESLVSQVKTWAAAPYLVVITGGEPFRQNVQPFVVALVAEGYRVQIETNGTLAPFLRDRGLGVFSYLCSHNFNDYARCFIVCSPKAGKVNAELAPLISAYKYVMNAGLVAADGLPVLALDHTASPHVARPHRGFKGPVYLQPCDDKDPELNGANLSACIASVLKHGYILQLQVHKIIDLE